MKKKYIFGVIVILSGISLILYGILGNIRDRHMQTTELMKGVTLDALTETSNIVKKEDK